MGFYVWNVRMLQDVLMYYKDVRIFIYQDVQMFPSTPVAIFLQPQKQELFNYNFFLKNRYS